jgi:hypothetical protein
MNAIAKPTVAERLLFAEYLDIDAASSTGLKSILTSGRMYKARKERPLKDNDTLRQGRAGHTAILEVEKFLLEYALWDGKKQGKRDPRREEWRDFQAMHAGKCIITAGQYDNAMRMREAVHEHPIARELLNEPGRNELTLRWMHKRTGTPCKARIDRLCSVMAEIKTCVDPSPKAFRRVARKLLYPVQMSFYRDGIIEALGQAPAVKCIAVQKGDPWDVVVHNIPTETLTAGGSRVEIAMDRLAECRAANKWPGMHWHDEPDLVLTEEDLDESAAEDNEPITFGEEVL